jgi:hypothetical protein
MVLSLLPAETRSRRFVQRYLPKVLAYIANARAESHLAKHDKYHMSRIIPSCPNGLLIARGHCADGASLVRFLNDCFR